MYAGGAATFEREGEVLTVRPAFGMAHEMTYDRVRCAPCIEALERDAVVGVLLVRLGGYAAAVFVGDRLESSKVGSRLVHARHRAGGSSANRFRRRREEQAAALHEAAAATAVRILVPWLDRLEAVVLGGDREAVKATLAERDDLRPARRARAGAVPDRAGPAPARGAGAAVRALRRRGDLGGALSTSGYAAVTPVPIGQATPVPPRPQ